MPQGFCIPPVCWNLTYNFAAAGILVIKPKDVPNWAQGIAMPLGSFPAMEGAFMAQLNAGANLACDHDCVCVRLHKKAVTLALPPQRLGAHPLGKTDVYMTGITVTGFWGVCLAKKWVKVKKGDKWIPVEDLPQSDILTPPSSSGGSSGGHKKKGKKGKKAGKTKANRRKVKRPR